MKLALGIFMFAVSGIAMAEQNACIFTRYNVCAETADFDLSEECSERGGSHTTACPTEGRVGSCEMKESGATMYLRYFNGFGMNPEKHCQNNKGTYIPN